MTDCRAPTIVRTKSEHCADIISEGAGEEGDFLRNDDERIHPYQEGVPSEQYGHSKQGIQDRKESRAAGGDNERGLSYIPQGFNRRASKPTDAQLKQWRWEEPDLLRKLQRGDYTAAETLVERYRWWLQAARLPAFALMKFMTAP
jgi:hypothetical protein